MDGELGGDGRAWVEVILARGAGNITRSLTLFARRQGARCSPRPSCPQKLPAATPRHDPKGPGVREAKPPKPQGRLIAEKSPKSHRSTKASDIRPFVPKKASIDRIKSRDRPARAIQPRDDPVPRTACGLDSALTKSGQWRRSDWRPAEPPREKNRSHHPAQRQPPPSL